MSRSLRVEFSGAVYHVMAHGNGLKWLNKDQQDIDGFKEVLSFVTRKYGFIFHCAVLMQTHIHLLVETPWGNLSKGMMILLREFAVLHNRRENRTGSVFKQRYKAILIQKKSYFETVKAYIYNNPVKAGFTNDPSTYPGSSLNWIKADDKSINRIISANEVNYVRRTDSRIIISEIRRYASVLCSKEYENMHILGDVNWIAEIKVKVNKIKIASDINKKRDWRERKVNIGLAKQVLKKYPSIKVKDALIYLIYTNTRVTFRDLARRFHVKSANAISQRMFHFRKAMALDSNLKFSMFSLSGISI